MTDVAYLCHHCGSVHEVESIRENLMLDLRTAASYDLSGHRGMLGARRRFLRWRMARGLARALWPGGLPGEWSAPPPRSERCQTARAQPNGSARRPADRPGW
jgi:hypothetical protein